MGSVPFKIKTWSEPLLESLHLTTWNLIDGHHVKCHCRIYFVGPKLGKYLWPMSTTLIYINHNKYDAWCVLPQLKCQCNSDLDHETFDSAIPRWCWYFSIILILRSRLVTSSEDVHSFLEHWVDINGKGIRYVYLYSKHIQIHKPCQSSNKNPRTWWVYYYWFGDYQVKFTVVVTRKHSVQ